MSPNAPKICKAPRASCKQSTDPQCVPCYQLPAVGTVRQWGQCCDYRTFGAAHLRLHLLQLSGKAARFGSTQCLSVSVSGSVCISLCVLVWGPHKLAEASEASTVGVAEKTVKTFEQKRQIYDAVWERWKLRILLL